MITVYCGATDGADRALQKERCTTGLEWELIWIE